MVEITDQDSARLWLEGRDQQTRICFAARAALRGLPGLGSEGPSAIAQYILVGLRATIIAAVAAKIPGADRTKAAFSGRSAVFALSARIPPNSAARSAFSAALAAGNCALSAGQSASNSANFSAFSAARSSHADEFEDSLQIAFFATNTDAVVFDQMSDPAHVFDLNLWPIEKRPKGLLDNLRNLRSFWQSDPEIWSFWHRWYDGFLSGNPIDWDVQLAVATLPEEDWGKGSEWIAKRIAEIEARIALQKRMAELEQALLAESAEQRGIGDNHPPEPITDISDVAPELVVVWEPLQSLQQETQADVPDPNRIRRAIKTLVGIAVSCGAWTWEKANTFLDAGLKAGGAAAGATAVAVTTGHGEKIVAVIKAALDWLVFWA